MPKIGKSGSTQKLGIVRRLLFDDVKATERREGDKFLQTTDWGGSGLNVTSCDKKV